MARTKQPKVTTKLVKPVKMRFKKLKSGGMSIYLDTWLNGEHSYEFLDVPHLVPEHTKEDKERNKKIIELAVAIMERRNTEIELNKGVILKDDKTPLLVWLEQCRQAAEDRAKSQGREKASYASNIANTIKHVRKYIESIYGEGKADKITLAKVDKAFCEGFVKYLSTATAERQGTLHRAAKPLSANTRNTYFTRFSEAMKKAVQSGKIAYSPLTQVVEKPKAEETERAHLTEMELKALIATECPCREIRDAFLFSCMCGLRWSDINALTWGNVEIERNRWWIKVKVQKTGRPLSIPLNEQAKKFLPSREGKTFADSVFSLPSLFKAERVLRKWTESAGITKHITFHCARHTYGYLTMRNGGNVYKLKELLGHKNVETTQIYARMAGVDIEDTADALNCLDL